MVYERHIAYCHLIMYFVIHVRTKILLKHSDTQFASYTQLRHYDDIKFHNRMNIAKSVDRRYKGWLTHYLYSNEILQ